MGLLKIFIVSIWNYLLDNVLKFQVYSFLGCVIKLLFDRATQKTKNIDGIINFLNFHYIIVQMKIGFSNQKS